MSPRAAWRLETLGFADVSDYVAGKVDWLAAGLPTEGTNAERPRAGDVAARDAPTCQLGDLVGETRDRVQSAGWDVCVVVNDEGVVLGLLRSDDLTGDRQATVEEVMQPGPSTFRPFVGIEQIARYMVEHDLDGSPITTSDGKLLGLLRRDDAVRVTQGLDHSQHDHE